MSIQVKLDVLIQNNIQFLALLRCLMYFSFRNCSRLLFLFRTLFSGSILNSHVVPFRCQLYERLIEIIERFFRVKLEPLGNECSAFAFYRPNILSLRDVFVRCFGELDISVSFYSWYREFYNYYVNFVTSF